LVNVCPWLRRGHYNPYK
jgi:AraC family transcriptional regulator, positive regulator of tynA and feaB